MDSIWGNTLTFCKFGHGVLVAIGIIEQAGGASIVALCMSVRPPNLTRCILGVGVVDAIEGGFGKWFWTDLKEEVGELPKPGMNMRLSPSYSRRSSIWRLRGFWDLGAHGFVRLFHRLTTDTFANALEG